MEKESGILELDCTKNTCELDQTIDYWIKAVNLREMKLKRFCERIGLMPMPVDW